MVFYLNTFFIKFAGFWNLTEMKKSNLPFFYYYFFSCQEKIIEMLCRTRVHTDIKIETEEIQETGTVSFGNNIELYI